MKYRIVGADGRTYGPVGLEQLRLWLAQGRLEPRTPVYVEGAPAWTTLGQLPELAPEASAPPPTITAAPGPAAGGTNGFATAALFCSVLSWICCCCVGMPFNFLGLLFAVIALAQLSSQTPPQAGRTQAIVALILSLVNMVVYFGASLLQAVYGNNSILWNGR